MVEKKLRIKGCKKFHDKNKWKPNATSTGSIAHTTRKGSSSKGRYCNNGGTGHINREKILHVTLGNIPKVKIKSLGKLVNPDREKIYKGNIYEEERPTTDNMYQQSSLKDGFRLKLEGGIGGKFNGQTGGPPNFEQPMVLQMKKLKKNNGYVNTRPIKMPSHKYGGLINQKQDRVFGEAETSVLKSSYKMYVSYISLHNTPLVINSDLADGGNMSDVPLRYVPMRNHHLTIMSYGDDSYETNLRNPYGDKHVPGIMSDMLTNSQVHKENDNHDHKYVEVDITISYGGFVNNHDHAFEDVKTMVKGEISKNESIQMICTSNSKEYKLIIKGT
ncbi:unnamed protein product [Vicia faba]|uniref:Uncharacterized protein n=1 Tax=Vicia faba TaxID=3906 RepID=A0AAV1A5A7_VICFA|nr:unnamed protein product [Vicia faba]